MPRALLKLRVGLRGSRWRYEAHPLRSEAKHNICRLIYHSAHLIPLLSSLPASFPPSYNTTAVSVTTTDCFSFRNLRLASFKRSWQLSPGWLREISFVLNPRHRHIKLRNEKILQFHVNVFLHFISLRFYVFL